MARILRFLVLPVGLAFAAATAAEKMAKPGQTGWQAAEGTGCLIWNANPQPQETVTWSGPCEGNRAVGKGELVWRSPKKTDRYVGEMRNGKRNGRGTAVSPSGDRFDGDWVEGKRVRGKMTKVNGDWYNGQWHANVPHGEGEAVIGGVKLRGMWDRGCLLSAKPSAAWGRAQHECP